MLEWIPIHCTCESIVADVSSDRNWIRYLCRDRDHEGGKVYAYIDLRNDPIDGVIKAVLQERLES